MDIHTSCPCKSNNKFSECCGSIINAKREAKTAEELMRSRYVAYTLAKVDYIIQSQHSKYRQENERKSILRWAKSVKWISLTIHNTNYGLENDKRGHVEFSAMFMENGNLHVLHEKSLFERENGKWVYVSGIQLKQ